MLICWWINLIIQIYFVLTTETSTRKASLLILTQHVKVFSVQTFAEVEKSCFLSDLKPIIFVGSCSRNDEILAQMEVGHFPMWIPQGMDAQERRACWLINVDVLRVLLPGEVEAKGHCKGRHTRGEVLPVKLLFTGIFLRYAFPKKQRLHSLRIQKDVEKGRSLIWWR